MPLFATTPTNVSATYDLWAIGDLRIAGDGCIDPGQLPDPGQELPTPQPVMITVQLVKARILGNGLWERSTGPSDKVEFSIIDVYKYVADGLPAAAEIGAAMGAVLAGVGAVGQARGVL